MINAGIARRTPLSNYYSINKSLDFLTDEDRLRVLDVIREELGYRDLCKPKKIAKLSDLLSENVKTDLDTISKIDLLKTGCLFSLALVCGCLIANKKGDIEVWRNIGYKAGLAFQIQDDCLDVISSEEKLGKSISDEKNQKSTFVSELGFEKAQKLYLQYFDEIENDLKKCNIHSEPILKIFQMIKNRDH